MSKPLEKTDMPLIQSLQLRSMNQVTHTKDLTESTIDLSTSIRTVYFKEESGARQDHINTLLNRCEESVSITQLSAEKLIPHRLAPNYHSTTNVLDSSTSVKLPPIHAVAAGNTDAPLVSGQLPQISYRAGSATSRSGSLCSRRSIDASRQVRIADPLNQSTSVDKEAQDKIADKKGSSEFFKRVLYDDTIPDNDDLLFHIRLLRLRLNWPVEFPTYEAGTRDRIQIMIIEEAKLSGLMPVDMNLDIDKILAEKAEEAEKKKVTLKLKDAVFAKPDDGNYVYCLPRNRNPPGANYNPYDLQVVSANNAKLSHQYWTVSASAITRFWKVQPPLPEENFAVTPVIQWLWEKQLFDKIKDLRVYSKFRLWKYFKTWLINVRHSKSHSCNLFLRKRLYCANEVLQGCLLHIQGLCEANLSSTTPSNTPLTSQLSPIVLLKTDLYQSYPLDQFIEMQKEQAHKGEERLLALRERIVDIVFEACATVAEMEGVRQGIRPDSSNRQLHPMADCPANLVIPTPPLGTDGQHLNKKKSTVSPIATHTNSPIATHTNSPIATDNNTQTSPPNSKEIAVRTIETATGSKRKSAKLSASRPPTYAEKTQWKKTLKRIGQFLRLVDCQLAELCHQVVLTSLEKLDKDMKLSWDIGVKIREDDLKRPQTLHSRNSARSKDERPPLISSKAAITPVQPVASQGYVIPKFDFDAPPKPKISVDPDELLRELKRQKEVIKIPSATFSIQLVLNVPDRLVSSKSRTSKDARQDAKKQKESSHNFDDVEVKEYEKEDDIQDDDGSDEDNGDESDDDWNIQDDDEDEEEDAGEAKKASLRVASGNRPASGSNRTGNTGASQETKSSRVWEGRSFVTLHHNSHQYGHQIDEMIQHVENTISRLPSISKDSRLQVFDPSRFDIPTQTQLSDDEDMDEAKKLLSSVSGSGTTWPNTALLLGKDEYYQHLVSLVRNRVNQGLNEAAKLANQYTTFCRMVDKARMQQSKIEAGKQGWSSDDFHILLHHFSEQIRALKSMVSSSQLNMFVVEAVEFSESCLPYPRKIIQAVQDRLPSLAHNKNDEVLQIIRTSTKRLDFSPGSVEEFVDHLSFLNKMSHELPAIEKEFVLINRLFSITRDFDIPMELESLALYKTLGSSFQHLKNTITYHEAKKEENLNKFTADLEKLISNMRIRIIDIRIMVLDPSFLATDASSSGILEQIVTLQDEVTGLSAKIRSYANYQERFGSSLQVSASRQRANEEASRASDGISAQTLMSELAELERDLTLRRVLWESRDEWTKLYEEWTNGAFEEMDVDQLQKSVNKFTQTIYMLEKGLPHNTIVPQLKVKVTEFKQGMPVVVAMRNPTLHRRHWEQIETVIQRTLPRDSNFTLGDLLGFNIFRHKDKIQDISATASNEATLESMLQKVVSQWHTTEFRLVSHAARETSIIAGTDDLLQQLEESQIVIAMIKGSRYVTPIKAQVEEWERRLALFNRTLEEWMSVQRIWLYLEQIFATPDIQRQLQTETKQFNEVDRQWKTLMRNVEDKPNAIKAGTAQGVLQSLQFCNVTLERVQKSLEDYLETKRLIFPRFYFLGNDELLDILAKSKTPEAVQPHLDKLFGNIRQLEIVTPARQPATVISMTSAEGEVLPMPKNVRARGPLEQWLGSVEQGMNDTVKKQLKLGLADLVSTPMEVWVLKHPGQVILTGNQINFNRLVLSTLTPSDDDQALSLTSLQDRMVTTLSKLATLVVRPLANHKRLALEAMLIVNVHNRDIVDSLLKFKVDNPEDFEWTKQLRYEWDESTNNCNVLQSNAVIVYGYEYLGCSPRLVLTPLTDRCYLTLTGALHLNLGGSPAGPAGTGKTETVKDLSKSVGKQCVVFNCSEGLDYKMMGKLFSGLVQSGSWCCFDEFNRIDIEVLSVVASQIHTIKTAKDGRLPRFNFEGRDIKLNMTCGIFITMNPTYAGRVELPDNLKSLFRPVAMMVPDYALIAEILLFSEGFVYAKSLSCKIVNLYELTSKQLSQQDHYDFGMRAIKSVLVMAGHMRVSVQRSTTASEVEEAKILIQALRESNLPRFVAEDVPIFDSIMGDLFPGMDIPNRDTPAMEKAIELSLAEQNLQLWPRQIEKVHQLQNQLMVRHGVMLVGPTGGGKTTVRNILQRSLSILPTITFEEEVDEETQIVKKIAVQMNRGKKAHVDTMVLNPKCVSMGDLYGQTDSNTLEWRDGLVAMVTRKFAKLGAPSAVASNEQRPARRESIISQQSVDAQPQEVDPKKHTVEHKNWQWIILDGPVDTIWVENLNTVLDDSKILCLASGERIGITPTMRYIFEVDNLSNASPATVSRCAMVYMDPVELGWRPFVGSWLSSRLPSDLPPSGRRHLSALLFHSIERGLQFNRQYRKHQPVIVPDLGQVQCLCALLAAYLNFMAVYGGFGQPDANESSNATSVQKPVGEEMQGKEDGAAAEANKTQRRPDGKQYHLQKNPKDLKGMLGKLFVFAFTWSFGSCFNRVDDPDQDRFTGTAGASKGGVSAGRPVDVAEEFDLLIHELFDVEPPLGVRLPSQSRSIYGYFVDLESGTFLPWDVLVPSTQSLIERAGSISLGDSMAASGSSSSGGRQVHADRELIVTTDILRSSFILALHLMNGSPVLVTGDPGVGKSCIVKETLRRLQEVGGTGYKTGTVLGTILNYSDRNQALLDSIQNLTKSDGDMYEVPDSRKAPKLLTITGLNLEFSAQTSASRLQQQMTSKLVKRGRDTLGAPKGKKIITFIDDINMPSPDDFGTQPPIEFIRQLLDSGGFYDTERLQWKTIVDVGIVGACAPVGGGRNQVSPRLIKHFCVLALPQPSTQCLQHIYQVQLGRYFHDNDFSGEVRSLLPALVSAAIAVYYKMRATMKPTPAKIHYTFNLRDLTKVIHGLFQAHEKAIVQRDQCAALLAHEATRVFHDRLCSQEDKNTFYAILAEDLHSYFKVRWSAEHLQKEAVVFGDFFDDATGGLERIYRPISDRVRLAQIMEDIYMKKNVEQKSMTQYVFFKEAVDHIIRAVRVLRQPAGHMLLVGLDGTGKTTTVQLAAFIARAETYRLTLTPGYAVADFRNDLKKVYEKAGLQGKNVVFLLTDSDLVKEAFLEDINCVLNSGDVPDLFDNEEMDSILMNLKKEATAMGVADTREDTYSFFLQRVSRNLHVILTLSPAGANFRQRCRANPALVNCCIIDWFDEWDRTAMLSVSQVYFRDEEFLTEDQSLGDSVSQVCVTMHNSAKAMAGRFWSEMRRSYYLTPSSFIEFIKTFSTMLHENRGSVLTNRDRLNNGLHQLKQANLLVGTMQDELVALGPQIENKAKETDELLSRLERDRAAVEEIRQMVLEERTVMQQETAVVEDYADQCEMDLASVVPALQTATEALKSLQKKDISEVRAYVNPPLVVSMVLEAVCVLLDVKPNWASAVLLMGDTNFLTRLQTYDLDNLHDKIFRKLKKYTTDPRFNPETIQANSLACLSISTWVLALEHYHDIHKMVKPKQKKVQEAKEALHMARTSLAKKQERLDKIQKHLDDLQARYQDSVNEREALKNRKEITALRLDRAALLIKALQSEKSRWEDSIEKLDKTLAGILGDTLVAAGFVAYLGTLTARYRHILLKEWLDICSKNNIPGSKSFDFVSTQFPANVLLDWHNQGLPKDPHSSENAVIVKKSRRWCLLIDPQHQGFKFLRGMEGSQLKVLSVTDPSYIQSLERCIRVGDPVLLENLGETLDPTLGPVLRQEIYQASGNLVVKIGENEIEYNDNFRLYLKTSYSNPHYLPAVSILVTIINFTVNFDGLEEQLLSSVVSKEKPDLESSRAALLSSLASDMTLLRQLEDETLGLLQHSTGHILDDEALPATLEKSKAMVAEIGMRVEQTEATQQQLSTARQVYLPVATRGATLYFVLSDLTTINLMYQFSLTWFQEMFEQCVANTLPGDDLNLRMDDMIERVTLKTYKVASAALFSHHQLVFSFLMCTSIMRARDTSTPPLPPAKGEASEGISRSTEVLKRTHWSLFLHGPVLASLMTDADKTRVHGMLEMPEIMQPHWVSVEAWNQCLHAELCLPLIFGELCHSIRLNTAQWTDFYECEEPHCLMTQPWKPKSDVSGSHTQHSFAWEKLSDFERLILIKILSPSKMQVAVRQLVINHLGNEFLYAGQSSFMEIYEQSEASRPIIFILASGADPTTSLLRLAREIRGSALHLDMVSLGRGQGIKAEELINKAPILKGRWIFLQNCDLAASWMPKLQQLVENFSNTTKMDDQFRLFLSSKPDSNFPISVLHSGIKMAVESPRGIKNILLRSFAADGTGLVSPSRFNSASNTLKSLIFSLTLFNAVILERKKYGPLGFNLIYEFNDSDLEVALLQMEALCTQQSINWAAVHHLIGDITYGGRVTDDWDRRCLNALLARYQNDNVLKPNHAFTVDRFLSTRPPDHDFEAVRGYLEELPEMDSPSAFGMGINSELASKEATTRTIVELVVSVQPRMTAADLEGVSGKDNTSSVPRSGDNLVQDLVKEMLEKLPKRVEDVTEEEPDKRKRLGIKPSLTKAMHADTERVEKDLLLRPRDAPTLFFRSALHNVLRQEIDRYDHLLQLINRSLRHLAASIVGDEVMTEELDQAYSSLLMNRVPTAWSKYASCKPLSEWTHDLVDRTHFLAIWAERLVRRHQSYVAELESQAKLGGKPGVVINQSPTQHHAATQGQDQSKKSTRPKSGDLLPQGGEMDEDLRSPRSPPAVPDWNLGDTLDEVSSFNADMIMLAEVEPTAYWLPGFFFPQGFITGVLQNHARKMGVSVDSLSMHFEVKNQFFTNQEELLDMTTPFNVKQMTFQKVTPLKDGVLLFGLYLDNACWSLESSSIIESPPGRRFCKMPEIHFRGVAMNTTPPPAPDSPHEPQAERLEASPGDVRYTCPLYRTSSRVGILSSTGISTNYVTSIDLPSSEHSDYWVLRGTALLTQPDLA